MDTYVCMFGGACIYIYIYIYVLRDISIGKEKGRKIRAIGKGKVSTEQNASSSTK